MTYRDFNLDFNRAGDKEKPESPRPDRQAAGRSRRAPGSATRRRLRSKPATSASPTSRPSPRSRRRCSPKGRSRSGSNSRLAPDGAIQSLSGRFALGAGTVRINNPDALPFLMDEASGGMAWDNAQKRLNVDKLTVLAGETSLSASGWVAPPADASGPWTTRLEAKDARFGPERQGENPVTLDSIVAEMRFLPARVAVLHRRPFRQGADVRRLALRRGRPGRSAPVAQAAARPQAERDAGRHSAVAAVRQSGRPRLGLAQHARRQARGRDDRELVGRRSRRHGPQARRRARQRARDVLDPWRRRRPPAGPAADDLGLRNRIVHRPRLQGRGRPRHHGPDADPADFRRQSRVRDPGHHAAPDRRRACQGAPDRNRRLARRPPQPRAFAQAGRRPDRPRHGQGPGRGRSQSRSQARQDRQARGLPVPRLRRAVEPDARQVRRAGEAGPGQSDVRRRPRHAGDERGRGAVRLGSPISTPCARRARTDRRR